MPTSTSGTRPAPDAADLPDPVVSALDEIETALPTVTPTDDLERRALAEDVVRFLARQLRDPLARALLSRPKIFSWCFDQALPPTVPVAPGSAARWAEPLPERVGDAEEAERPADDTVATRSSRKGRKS